ncbi:very-long-chain (3R)-3-hydroxyacyl-CoA dehydratase 2 [Eucalyptus grandis]|nr:very-long-chain (3R)-3-hydroxyacyl-CoA dehydratase 2 [Eucalyptus grandis]
MEDSARRGKYRTVEESVSRRSMAAERRNSRTSRLSNLYLFAYNSLQAFGWSVSLFRILRSVVITKSVDGAYAAAGELICLLQAAAFLEVLHGALGIVPSGVLFPLMQWAGRTHFLLAIVRRISEIQESPSVFITFIAWCLSDVIRYLHYALNCLKCCPPWITYLRYTTFIVLYPLGIAPGEIWLMFQALPFIKKTGLYAGFFSSIPFNYYDFVRVLLLFYPFLWFKLYLHLFKQRRSKLGKRHEKKKN